MDPKTVIGLAATLGPLIKDLVKKSPDPEKLAAVESQLKAIEERIAERFAHLERELAFAKWSAYAGIALAVLATGFAFYR